MRLEDKKRNKLKVTYLYPFRFIVNKGEKLDFSIEEINNLSYNHFLLCRIIGSINNKFEGLEVSFIICGDGAICVDGKNIGNLDLHINDLFCKLLLGGLMVDAISSRDITDGYIHNKKYVWPVNYGDSLNSHLHASVRQKTTGNTDAICLFNASDNSFTIEQLEEFKNKGERIISKIENLSTYHLLNGVTEYRYKNWSASLTYLWIVVEEIIDFLWRKNIIKQINDTDIYKMRKSMLEDNRTYTTSVKLELLFQKGFLCEELYNDLFVIRHARNKLIHEGKLITKDTAAKLYSSIHTLMSIASEQDVCL